MATNTPPQQAPPTPTTAWWGPINAQTGEGTALQGTAIPGGQWNGEQFVPSADAGQQNGDGNGDALSSLLGDVQTSMGSGVGSAAATAPAYNFDGTNTSTTSSGPNPIIWLMLVLVAGGGLFWFLEHRKKKAAGSPEAE